MRVYLAGTVQGSFHKKIIDQSYRKRLTEILKKRYSDLEIDDPQEDYKDGLKYDIPKARTAFMDCVHRAQSADVVIAYIPEVSMGTAIEMFSAFYAGKDVLAITPYQTNWAVLTSADRAFSDIDQFERMVEMGVFDSLFMNGKKTVEYAKQHNGRHHYHKKRSVKK